MLIPVEVATFAVDPATNSPLLVLKERGGERTIPVAIGPMEASSIAIKSLDVSAERPLTIDVAKSLMDVLGGRLEKVVIAGGKESGHDARLYVVAGPGVCIVESRPSDAISLALRCNSPIFVTEDLFQSVSGRRGVGEQNILRAAISNMDTLSFGTYYLE